MITLPTSLSELTARAAAHNKMLLDDPRLLSAILQKHSYASPGHVVPLSALRSESLARHDARFHPRRITYRVDAVQRAVAHHRERPGSLIAEWSALALLGLGEFSSGADTTILCSAVTKLTADDRDATVRRRRKYHRCRLVEVAGVVVAVTDHMQTLAACLRSLSNGEHSWDTIAQLKLDPATVMAVQLIDRFCNVFGCGHDDIRTGLAGLYSARRLDRLLALSCPGAQSRPETILRLLAVDAVADLPGVTFEAQVPVYTDGTVGEPGVIRENKTLLTVFDLADRRLRVGLMHDGEHHLQRDQRDKDAEITADLLALGWGLLRTSAGMLRRTSDTQRRVRNAVVSAREKLAAAG